MYCQDHTKACRNNTGMQDQHRQRLTAPVPAAPCKRGARVSRRSMHITATVSQSARHTSVILPAGSVPSVTVDFPLKMLALGRAAGQALLVSMH